MYYHILYYLLEQIKMNEWMEVHGEPVTKSHRAARLSNCLS